MSSKMLSTLFSSLARSAIICTSVLTLNVSTLAAATCSPGIGGTGKQADQKGIGGTGKQADQKGIGGTGKQADQKGIGGTGKQIVEGSGIGGTGIIGTISSVPDSYSICVSGIKITHKPTTSIYVNNKPSSIEKLHVGQVVSIHAYNNGKNITASRINVNYNLAGNIEFINSSRYSFMAAGQTVQLHKTIRHKIKSAKTGHHVIVSGLRKSNGTIVATAIKFSVIKRKLKTVRISGKLSKIDDNQFYLNGLPIKNAQKRFPGLVHNMQVTVHGLQTAKGITLKKLDKHAKLPFNGRFKKLILEGYLAKSALAGAFSLNGANISLTKKTNVFGAPKEQLVTDSRIHAAIWLDSNSRMSARAIRINHDRFERKEQDKPSRKDRRNKKDNSPDSLKSKNKAKDKNDDGDRDSDEKEEDDDRAEKDDDGEKKDDDEAPES